MESFAVVMMRQAAAVTGGAATTVIVVEASAIMSSSSAAPRCPLHVLPPLSQILTCLVIGLGEQTVAVQTSYRSGGSVIQVGRRETAPISLSYSAAILIMDGGAQPRCIVPPQGRIKKAPSI